MKNHLNLPEPLRKKILNSVGKAIAANKIIGNNAIEVAGAVVLQKGLLDDSLAKLTEIRGLLDNQAIQQS